MYKWAAFNPAGKTAYARKTVKLFNSFEEAQAWINDGRRVKHGYTLHYVPCCRENNFENWHLDFSHPFVKKNFSKKA